MIREVIRPQQNSFTITIPNSYINKEVEFIMFPLDTTNKQEIKDISEQNIKSLRGVFNKYANNSKIELEKNAWQNHIIEKYNA